MLPARRILLAVTLLLAVLPVSAAGTAAPAAVAVYPSSQSIAASGPLPASPGSRISLHAAIGEREGALLAVAGAERVSVTVAPTALGTIPVRLFFAHFVAAGGRPVADALVPWDGIERTTQKRNQPILVQVEIPYGTPAGTYSGSLTVTADKRATNVPLEVEVFPVTLPQPGTRVGNLLSSFHLSPESYVRKAAELYGFQTNAQRSAANRSLFALLGAYRISPGSWGFAEPRRPLGYETSAKWWLDSAGNFLSQLGVTPGFSAMRLPISSQRTSEGNYIAGLSPLRPESWCDYLREVRGFWARNGILRADTVPYLFGLDEPGLEGQRLVARQAAVVHRCFEGGRQLMTGNPSPANAFLWDGKRGDDLDIWTVLSRRYYGRWTSPGAQRAGTSRAREYERTIQAVRRRGGMVWSYTYTGTPGTPGFAATEPLSNPRMLMLWTALEGVEGVLYGQGTTSYTRTNPFESIGTGEFVLLYPGSSGPIASARLEQIRDGIEDWALYNMVRKRKGSGAVRTVLGGAGLFSASHAGVRLACDRGCELRSKTKYAWPVWSRDATTPRRIESARLAALRLASS